MPGKGLKQIIFFERHYFFADTVDVTSLTSFHSNSNSDVSKSFSLQCYNCKLKNTQVVGYELLFISPKKKKSLKHYTDKNRSGTIFFLWKSVQRSGSDFRDFPLYSILQRFIYEMLDTIIREWLMAYSFICIYTFQLSV